MMGVVHPARSANGEGGVTSMPSSVLICRAYLEGQGCHHWRNTVGLECVDGGFVKDVHVYRGGHPILHRFQQANSTCFANEVSNKTW